MTAPRTRTFEVAGITWQISPLDTDQQFEVECILIKALAPALAAGLAAAVQGGVAPLLEVLAETSMGGGQHLAEFDAQEECEEAKLAAVVDHGPDAGDQRWTVTHPSGRALFETADEDEANYYASELRSGKVVKRGRRWVVVSAPEDAKFDLAHLLSIDTSDPRLRSAWEKLLDAVANTSGDVLRETVFVVARHLEHRDIKRLFELAVFSNHTLVCDPTGERAPATMHDLGYAADFAVLSRLLARDPRAKYELLGEAIKVTYRPTDEDEDA